MTKQGTARMPVKMKRFTFEIPAWQLSALNEIARDAEMSVSALVRTAVKQMLAAKYNIVKPSGQA
jgi:Ribbon-helix-helix protein, copG family